MVKSRSQPKITNIGIISLYIYNDHGSSISAICVVLSKAVGMINHPQKYLKNMNEPVRSNTIEKAKKKFSRGVGCHLGTWLKTVHSAK